MGKNIAWRICHRRKPPRGCRRARRGERLSNVVWRLTQTPLQRLDRNSPKRKLGAMTDKSTTLVPEEGWHCLHLFYHVEYGQWQLLNRDEQNAAKTNLTKLVQEVRAMDSTQLLTLSVVTPKADLGFMLITADLHDANKVEKQLSLSLGADVLTPVYSYLSLTEESEYITTDEEYTATLDLEIRNDPAKLEAALSAFRDRMKHYR